MFALAVLALTPPAPAASPPELADLHTFGVCREVAVLNRRTADRHWDWWLARPATTPGRDNATYRQYQTTNAWTLLADALDERQPANIRVNRLNCLRTWLGEDAYYAGWMPAAVPDYGDARPWVD